MLGRKDQPTTEAPTEPAIHEPGAAEFPRRGSSGHGTHRLFSVEVRLDYSSPSQLGDFIIDREWRTLPVRLSPIGVPNKTFSKLAEQHGLFSWEAANALRWWAHASCGLCLQSRIVEHKFVENYSEEIVGYHDVVGGGGSDERTRMAHGPVAKAATTAIPLSRPSKN